MNIIGIWNNRKVTGESEISWPFGTLNMILGENITIIKNNSVKIIYEGTIFDRTPDELIDSQTALDNAYGLYSYVKINKDKQEIIIGTDKLGFSPIYYSLKDENLFFSTSLTLLKYKISKVSPDYEAWDEILNIGDILGNKTTIKEIKRLNPGMRIHINEGKVSYKTFWDAEIPEQFDINTYVKKNNELLSEALELTRKMENTKIIFLSGGEDSRRIGVSAAAMELPFIFATQEAGYLGGEDKDTKIAGMVSECFNREWIQSEIPSIENYYSNYVIRDYWLGYETNQHEWILPLLKKIPPNSLIYDGIAGDVTINAGVFRPYCYPTLIDYYKDKDVDKIARIICGAEIMFPMMRSKLDSSCFERVRNIILEYPECPHRVNYFYLITHTRRNIQLMAQLYNLMGHKTCFPFLYYPLFMQSLSITPDLQLRFFYQKECMKELNPGVANIPSTKGRLNREFIIDRFDIAEKWKSLIAANVMLRSDIIKLFPKLQAHLLIYKLASLSGSDRIKKRMNWRVLPLSRMSMFLDWLEDSNSPEFPINVETPAFLKKNVIS